MNPTAADTRIAYVGADRQLHVVRPDGQARKQVTFPKVPGPLMAWGGTSGRDASSWPCWSPDGRWLACFQAPDGEDSGGPAAVCVVEVDGVEERQLASLRGQLPIYAQWSPDGHRLAVLAQDEDDLQLSICSLDDVGHRRVVDEGVPLFFTWTPSDARLLIHVGSRHDHMGRLVVRDPTGAAEDLLFPDSPGSFCTPLFMDGSAVYVTGGGRNSAVCVASPHGEKPVRIATLEGLLAVVPSPAGGRVAVGSAPRGESTPYKGIWLASLTGEMIRVTPQDCTAFFWSPDGHRLVYAVMDPARNAMQWWRVDLPDRAGVVSGEVELPDPELVATFWPSQDQLFFMHFFEQYAHSHSNVSPDGRLLVYASHPDPRDDRSDKRPRIMVADLDHPGLPPVAVAEGSFAVFNPANRVPSAPVDG